MAQPQPNITVQSSNLIPTLPQNFSKSLHWLEMAEIYLNNCSSTQLDENQKFLALYNALPHSISSEESDLLTSASATKYTDLQNRLKAKFEVNKLDKFSILTKPEPIGDRTPSQYYAYIKKGYQQAGLNDPEAIKLAFAKGLPEQSAMFVHMADANNLEEVAKLLDGSHNFNKAKMVQAYMVESPSGSGGKELENLTKKVEELNTVTQGLVKNKQQSHNNNVSQDKSAGIQPCKNQNDPKHQSHHTLGYRDINKPQNNSYESRSNHRQYRESCPEPPNVNRTYGLCPRHIRFGASAYSCDSRSCRWNFFKVPFHRCTLRVCKWARYYPKDRYANFSSPQQTYRKN